jgi:tRNA pseudouridine-54 N-methylase
MEVKMLEEYEDGSALISIEATEIEKMVLLQEGFISLIKRAVEQEEKARKVPVLQRKQDSLEDFQP